MKYYIRGKLFPTLLTAFPIVSVYVFVISPFFVDVLKKVLPLVAEMSKVGFPVAIVFFLTQVNRTLSKGLIQSIYFKGEIKMPTTEFLLHDDSEYSADTKARIRAKIKEYFDINLYERQQELANEKESRLLIKEAVGRVRNLLRGDEMLFRHNVEYGALRNFLGGCIQACFFSIVLIGSYFIKPHDLKLLYLGVFYLIVYGFFLAFSKLLMQRYGNDYARILYQQFLSYKQPVST